MSASTGCPGSGCLRRGAQSRALRGRSNRFLGRLADKPFRVTAASHFSVGLCLATRARVLVPKLRRWRILKKLCTVSDTVVGAGGRMATQFILFQNFINSQTLPVLSRALTASIDNGSITDITLAVGSPGGGVSEGIALYGLVRALPKPVTFHGIGNVDSIAITVMLACDKRLSTPQTRFAFHPMGGGTVPTLTVRDGQQRVDTLRHDQDRLKSIYRQRANIDGRELDELFERDCLHDNAWALKNGFITGEKEFYIPLRSHFINAS